MKTEKEILEAVRVLQEANPHDEGIQNWVRYYFPELKDSEDDRIRKRLIAMCQHYIECYALDPYNLDGYKEALAWLEKQNEQNLPIEKLPFEMKTVSESLGFTTQKECDDYNKMVTDLIMSDDGKGEQKPANKVEPKFKVGDNIEPIDSCLGSPLTIYKICDGFYKTNQGTLDFEFENNWRLVEQKPAWSKEDETKIKSIIAFLKSPALCTMDGNKGIIDESIKYLKSLKERYTWKPSDEHYELEEFAKIVRGNLTGISKAVQELFEAKYLQLTGNKMYGGFKD